MELAETTFPVINQLSANVSMLPVMRQLTAFAIDLPWVSGTGMSIRYRSGQK
jgi:hypothetical protein